MDLRRGGERFRNRPVLRLELNEDTRDKNKVESSGLSARPPRTHSFQELLDPYEALNGNLLSVRKPCVIIGQNQLLKNDVHNHSVRSKEQECVLSSTTDYVYS